MDLLLVAARRAQRRIAPTSVSSAGTAIDSATWRTCAGGGWRRPRSSAAASMRTLVELQIRSASARNSTLPIDWLTPAGKVVSSLAATATQRRSDNERETSPNN